MFELCIGGINYQFNFGMGFLKAINKTETIPIEGLQDVRQKVGLRMALFRLHDNDLEALSTVLYLANINKKPRITQEQLDNYLEAKDTDHEKLFEDVLDFLSNAKCTAEAAAAVQKVVEEVENQPEQAEES